MSAPVRFPRSGAFHLWGPQLQALLSRAGGWRAWGHGLFVAAYALLAAGCGSTPQPSAPPLSELPVRASLGDLEAARAHFAIAPQGPAPAGWSPIEASLRSEDCRACHPQQYAEWSGSRHAAAVGPALLGQERPDEAACMTCHAPLPEQRESPSLQAEGVSCAACHVRSWARLGPDDVADDVGEDGADGGEDRHRSPHGGAEARAIFKEPSFCSPCHDFPAHGASLAGKQLQETGAEWSRTEAAAAGETCQSCHMPGGSHAFPGVHDPGFVAAGLAAELEVEDAGGGLRSLRASLSMQNVGAAHRLPTYATPEIYLVMVQLQADGAALVGSERRALVGRTIAPDGSAELADTRLMPGERARLDYLERRDGEATALEARIEVWPDEGYRRQIARRLQSPLDEASRALMTQALAESLRSRFVVWEARVDLTNSVDDGGASVPASER